MRRSAGALTTYGVAALLLVLLVVLGYLQWRWAEELSRSAGRQLRINLAESARQIVDPFDVALSETYFGVLRHLTAGDPASTPQGFDTDLVDAAFLGTPSENGSQQWHRWQPGDRVLRPTPAPSGVSQALQVRPPWSLRLRLDEEGVPFVATRVPERGLLVVRFDRQTLWQLLRQVSEAPIERAQSTFAVTLQHPVQGTLFQSSAHDTERRPDAMLPIGELRPPDLASFQPRRSAPRETSERSRRTGRRPPSDEVLRRARSRRGGLGFGERPPRDLLTLEVRQLDASLEQAVARSRRTNLMVGLGIVALLGASAAYLVLWSRRAQQLATQHMDFVAAVTHEINTPLTAIRNAGQNLADGLVTDPERTKSYGELLTREGKRLSHLVQQVLSTSRLSVAPPHRLEPIVLLPLLESSIEGGRALLDETDSDVQVRCDPTYAVRGDRALLERVMANLLSNAAKYGGEQISVEVETRGNDLEILVRDNGEGIAAEDRQRVFDAFYRASSVRSSAISGSGLGLHIAREAVAQMKGDLALVDSDGGAAFVVRLPRATVEPGNNVGSEA